MLKSVQVTSRDHRWVSPWCWSQYRWHHVITGERVLDVEASTGAVTSTDEWTVFQWIWHRHVCFVQRTSLWTVLCWPQLSVVNHLNWGHHWHYRNTRFQQQQQQHHWSQHNLHLCHIYQNKSINKAEKFKKNISKYCNWYRYCLVVFALPVTTVEIINLRIKSVFCSK